MKTDIQRDIYDETLRKFNAAAASGIAESGNENISDTFLEKIRQGNEIFSAFRTHRMQNEIAARLLDGRGRLKSFDKWKQDVKGITNHFVGPWLKTEYNTAVIRAHQAADWQHFVDEADVYPNVRWMPTTSPNQDPLHRHYWERKLTLPVDDPFWNEHHPGDRWNCKCSLRQTDDPVNDSAIREFKPVPAQKGLENNPGKDGSLFSDSHSYFPNACSSCPFNKNAGFKNAINSLFINKKKDCFRCSQIKEAIPGDIKEEIKKLQKLKGKEYWEQLESIARRKEFKNIDNGIYSAASDKDPDYKNLLNAARMCVKSGYNAYIMPNPKGLKTADIILEKKGVYRLYDIKTISGKSSVSSRLYESREQANNAILNITSRYNARRLSDEIKEYYYSNKEFNELIICYKGTIRLTLNRGKVTAGLWRQISNEIR